MIVPVLLVTLELKGSSVQYSELYDLLKAQEGWAHYLGPAWCVATSKSPAELGREINPLLQKGDRFLVVPVSTGEYWGLAPGKFWEWIKRHSS